jgi:hypothetical protein
VRGVGGNDEDLSCASPLLSRADGEHRPATPNNESLGVRMLVQPRPDATLCRRLENDRDVGLAWKLIVVLGPVFAVVATVGTIDDEPVPSADDSPSRLSNRVAAAQRLPNTFPSTSGRSVMMPSTP